MGHEGKEPDYWVDKRLLEAGESARLTLVLYSIGLDTSVGELSLLMSEPLGGKREVWQAEESNNRNHESDDTLQNEEPPTHESVLNVSVQTH